MSSASTASPALLARSEVFQPKAQHKSTIIWMHGLGDSSEGFRSLFQEQVCPALPNAKVILPNAPMQSVTVNGGLVMPSWYDIYSFERTPETIGKADDEKGILQSLKDVHELVDNEVSHLNGAASKLLVGGFSQGAALSLLTGITSPHRLGGIAVCSGYVLLLNKLATLKSAHSNQLKVFAWHGEVDDIVPVAFSCAGYDWLQQLGIKVNVQSEPYLTHSMSPDEIKALITFFKKQLDK